MNKLSNYGVQNLSVSEAEAIIRGRVRAFPTESVPLDRAIGRVLREEIRADRDFPPFDRITMDGIALSFASYERGTATFKIQETQGAGRPKAELRNDAGCIEVMTGGVLPAGCDCVVPVEHYERFAEIVALKPGVKPTRLQNVNLQGSDYHAGEVLLSPGALLRAPEIAVCASVGKDVIMTSRSPRIALITTGDELVGIDETPEPYQIRISNCYAMEAALRSAGYEHCVGFHLPDDREIIRSSLQRVFVEYDLVVLSGGVSQGKFDYLPELLEELGVIRHLHKVRQRPGRPLWFGETPEGVPVFALPGNPVSSLVCLFRYVLPFLGACTERVAPVQAETAATTKREQLCAILADTVEGLQDLTFFLPVKVALLPEGRILAHPQPVHGSGDFASLVRSDGFLELPEGQGRIPAGSSWPFYRWRI